MNGDAISSNFGNGAKARAVMTSAGKAADIFAAAGVNGDGGGGHPRRLPKKCRLPLVRLDEMDVRRPHDRQHQARQSRPASEIDEIARWGRQMPEELTAVEDMPAPDISQTLGADEIDAGVPALEQCDVGLEARPRFT